MEALLPLMNAQAVRGITSSLIVPSMGGIVEKKKWTKEELDVAWLRIIYGTWSYEEQSALRKEAWPMVGHIED